MTADPMRTALERLVKNHGAYIYALPGETGVSDLEFARAALASPPVAGLSVEGWKLVPVEPDDAMHMAAAIATKLVSEDDRGRRTTRYLANNMLTGVYRAMLAASPLPPAVEGWRADEQGVRCVLMDVVSNAAVDQERAIQTGIRKLLALPPAPADPLVGESGCSAGSDLSPASRSQTSNSDGGEG